MKRNSVSSKLLVLFLLFMFIGNISSVSDQQYQRLAERTKRLEDILYDTLSALSTKLGQPFDRIATILTENNITSLIDRIEEPENELATQNYVTTQVDDLKVAVTCSLANNAAADKPTSIYIYNITAMSLFRLINSFLLFQSSLVD